MVLETCSNSDGMSSTVILGAGIVGVATAYHLSEHQPPSTVHLVDPAQELFSSASGKAAGFLAKDWFSPAVASLGALSYELHRTLVETKNGRELWGYSPSTSLSYKAFKAGNGPARRGDEWLREGTSRAGVAPSTAPIVEGRAPPWLRRVSGDELELISEDGSTAQIDPKQLCQFLLQEVMARGVKLHHPASVLSLGVDVRGELASACIADVESCTETDLPCTRIVIAAGCWSPDVFRALLPHSQLKIHISPLAGHSLLLKSPRWHQVLEHGGCHAVYTTHDNYSPEIFSRADGHIYVAGLNSFKIPLPAAVGKEAPADREAVDREAFARLRDLARRLLGPDAGEDDLEVVREALCFRPVTPWGAPIIARIPDSDLGPGMSTRPGADGGVYLAAGHGPWGISLSLGTGMVLAELMQGRPLSTDISALGFR